MRIFGWVSLVVLSGLVVGVQAQPDPILADAEAKRIAVINSVSPAVVAVCSYGGQGSGSGVLIDPEGYALTNFHVTDSTGPIHQCGLSDGELYDSVLVGLDKVGDVALIKLIPKVPGKPFPFVKIGDSDTVRPGDWSLAMGNPFVLSLDFTPTVTYGLVSGVNRYQPPASGGILEYTDCIQIETSINPGNSGGPLFNMKGELIGINGRGSFEKRGRVNSGVGYAISINQIKNFLGHLKAGIDTDHATLGASIETENEDGALSKMVVRSILEESDAFRRGLQLNDQVVSFAGRPLTSRNQYKNILGIFPKDWRLPLSYRRGNEKKEVLVRLMGSLDTPSEKPMPEPKQPGPRPQAAPKAGMDKSPAKKLYEPKPGFSNYYFNKERQKELWTAFQKQGGDWTTQTGSWTLNGTIELVDRKGNVKLSLTEGSDGLTEVKLDRGGIVDAVKPLKGDPLPGEMLLPQGSGGMLVAVYQFRRLLTLAKSGFELGFDHGGVEPIYPPVADGSIKQLLDARLDCEVLRTKHGSTESKWYFDPKTRVLLAGEFSINKEEDPCELYFSNYLAVDGKQLPHRIEVRHGDKKYGVLVVSSYEFGKK
jgi:serine protease Do